MALELLIDADSAIYKAGCANETRSYLIVDDEVGSVVHEVQYAKEADQWIAETKQKHGGEYSRQKHKVAGPIGHTLANTKLVCQNMTALEHTDRQLFISGEGNFRYDVAANYKGQRDPMDRPIHEEEIRDYLISYWGAQKVDGEEADDRVSYMQCLSDPKSTCIVSIDKDLLNTPGYNYNYDKELLRYITEEEANLNFARQLLTGDTTDNIQGIKGVGPKRTLALLPDGTIEWEKIVKEVYVNHYGDDWLEKINIAGQLLWMRRVPNEMWEFKE